MAPVITKEMSLTEVLAIDQSTAAVFMDFGNFFAYFWRRYFADSRWSFMHFTMNTC